MSRPQECSLEPDTRGVGSCSGGLAIFPGFVEGTSEDRSLRRVGGDQLVNSREP